MLYQLGPVTIDTFPFNVDQLQRNAVADLAVKSLIGTLPGREFMGEGDDKIAISGQLLPVRLGGMTELEMLHGYRRSGTRLPVMRGDGKMLGWFAIESIGEQHTELQRHGLPFVLKHSIGMVRVAPDGTAGIVGILQGLFGVL